MRNTITVDGKEYRRIAECDGFVIVYGVNPYGNHNICFAELSSANTGHMVAYGTVQAATVAIKKGFDPKEVNKILLRYWPRRNGDDVPMYFPESSRESYELCEGYYNNYGNPYPHYALIRQTVSLSDVFGVFKEITNFRWVHKSLLKQGLKEAFYHRPKSPKSRRLANCEESYEKNFR